VIITREKKKKKEKKKQQTKMVATELILGMGEMVNHIRELEEKNKKLEEEKSAMKEELAEKFYKHYDDMGYNKLNIARTVGSNLGRMIEHLIKENKKLQEKNEELQEEQLTEENAIRYVYENTDEYDDWVKDSTIYQELKEENKKLKEQEQEYQPKGSRIDPEGLHDYMKEEIEKLEEENKLIKDEAKCFGKSYKKLEEELLASNTALEMVKDENEVNKKNMMKFMKESRERQTIIANEVARREKLEQENNRLKRDYQKNWEAAEILEDDGKEWNGEEWVDEEEKISYEDEDDWDRGYGYTIKNGEYRIHIQGGCEDWIDYVINRKGCFVRNQYGDEKVFAFVSCPEGNYVKVWKTPHDHGGLTLREGETDMFEIIQNCYEEEIMNYETDEEDECFPGR